MKKQKRINLNLASHPKRNRRLFFLLVGLLSGLIILVSAVGGYTYLKYVNKKKNIASSKSQIEEKLRNAQAEERQLVSQIEKASQKYKERVDLVNSLIYKKSFSWLNLLSALEESLPGPCYIISLAPSLAENSRIEVRSKVASPNLRELLNLNKNLYNQGFSDIRTLNEGKNEAGLFVWEISFVYERTL